MTKKQVWILVVFVAIVIGLLVINYKNTNISINEKSTAGLDICLNSCVKDSVVGSPVYNSCAKVCNEIHSN